MKRPPPTTCPSASGFTLVEVIIALGVFVVAITVLMGVIPAAMKQVQTTSIESFSMTVMEDIRDDLALALATRMKKSLRYGLTLPSAGATTPLDCKIKENGELATTQESAVFHIIGTFRRPTTASPGPLQLHMRATWPATAPAGRESGAIELVGAFQP